MCSEDNKIKRKIGSCHRSIHDENELRMSQMLLNKAPIDLIDYPNYFNLMKEYPLNVKNQFNQGCCAGMALSVLRESFLKDKEKELSPAFLYWQSRVYEGEDVNQDTGICLKSGLETLKRYGICEEEYMKFDSNIWNQPPSEEAYSNAKIYKIDTYINLDNGISGIKSYLYSKKKPVIFGMEIYDGFIKGTGKDGIVPVPNQDEKPLDGHSALIIGYKDNTFKDNLISLFNKKRSKYGYFIVLNSYGKDFGKQGLYFLPYEYLLFNKAYDFYVITTKNNLNYQLDKGG